MSAEIQIATSPANKWQLVAGAYFGYGLFACFAAAYLFQGWAWILPGAFIVALVPILDALFGEDLSTRNPEPRDSLAGRLLWFAPHGFIIGYAICVLLAAKTAQRMTVIELIFATYSTGLMGSIAITASHELIHKTSPLEKLFGRLGLTNVCYLHFEINHIHGHHVHSGTPLDESTAYTGESLYAYFLRTVPGCIRLSWRLEARRLARKGLGPWHVDNLMLQFLTFQLLYIFLIGASGGWLGLRFFLLQSSVAVFLLESVAYIEHYGLLRDKLPHDRYGNMTPAHSWDSYHRFSNYLEFHLQRHADHHSYPAKTYAELQPMPTQSPRLPAGYPVMTILAMVPPLWRSIMDPRIPAKT